MLQIAASAEGATAAFLMLKDAVGKTSQTIGVSFGEKALVKAGPMRVVALDLQNTGSGPYHKSGC